MTHDYRTKLRHNIEQIGEYFFIDPEQKTIGSTTFPHWNTTLLALSYVMDQNALLVGEPGFAKTTAAKMLSTMSGYPFDLYEAAQIQGHPDQTYETMIARLDFAKLRDREEVIWLTSAYLPVRVVDEINRLPAGNQDELLNTLETGRFNYLNATFFTGKSPFFATANHPDDGNHILIPPMRDRFSIHVELGYIGASYEGEIEAAEDNMEEIKNEELTTRIMGIINDSSKTVGERKLLVDEARRDFVEYLEAEEPVHLYVFDKKVRRAVQEEIKQVPISTEARVLREMINSELNMTASYGRKRSNDKPDTSNHAQQLASSKVKNGFSPRASNRALKRFAQALAFLQGEKEVRKDHITAMAPHVIGHRIEFTSDFRSEWEDKQRTGTYLHEQHEDSLYGLPMEMHLAEKLVQGIEENYKNVKANLDLLFTSFYRWQGNKSMPELTDEQEKKVQEMLSGEVPLDHPLMQEYAWRMKKIRG